jgi:hypothetical protein
MAGQEGNKNGRVSLVISSSEFFLLHRLYFKFILVGQPLPWFLAALLPLYVCRGR